MKENYILYFGAGDDKANREVIKAFIKMPQNNFVMKFHPQERIIEYKKLIKGFDNIKIVNKNVHKLIKEAVFVIIGGTSTTYLESVIASKPTIIYYPYKLTGFFFRFPIQKASLPIIQNVTELKRVLTIGEWK